MRRLADHKVPLSPKFYALVTLRVSGTSGEEERNRLLNSKYYNDVGKKTGSPSLSNSSLKYS